MRLPKNVILLTTSHYKIWFNFKVMIMKYYQAFILKNEITRLEILLKKCFKEEYITKNKETHARIFIN